MKGSKRGSPVRIFTNINPADVVLPSAEGYRYKNVMFNTSCAARLAFRGGYASTSPCNSTKEKNLVNYEPDPP